MKSFIYGPDNCFKSKLLTKLDSLSENLEARQVNHSIYKQYIKHPDVFVDDHNFGSIYWRQNIFVKNNRDKLLNMFKNNNIKASSYYPTIHGFFEEKDKVFPVSDKITNSVINLWIAEETNTEYITKTQKIIEEF